MALIVVKDTSKNIYFYFNNQYFNNQWYFPNLEKLLMCSKLSLQTNLNNVKKIFQ